jgi:hypothetical protein
MADDKTENEAVSFGTSSSRPTHTDVDIEVELTEVAAAIEPSENEGDSPDSGWKLGQFQESLGYDVVQTDPTGEAIADCDRYVLRYYRLVLKLVGWIHFRRYPGLPLKVLRWIYVMVLTLMIFITFAIQIAICYQRDGFRIMLSPSQSNVTTCDADNHVVMTIVLDLLLIGSYWFGIYLFSGQGDSEHLFSLVSRTVVKYYQLEDRQKVGTIRKIITVYLGAGLLWIILSFSARLLQGIGLGLFPAEYTLEVHWGDTIVPLTVQIVLGVVCLLGFVLFDLVYLAAVINYAIQSEFNIQFVRAICQLVTQKKYSKLDLAIKDIGEAKSYLDLLNGRTAFIVALVLFNFGSGAIAGFIALNTLSNVDATTRISYGLALTAVGLGTFFWLALAIAPFIQASRLTSVYSILKQTATSIRTRPFQYADTAQLDLDSYTIYTLASHMRAKLFGVPIYPWALYGGVSLVLFVMLLLIQNDIYTLFHLVV